MHLHWGGAYTNELYGLALHIATGMFKNRKKRDTIFANVLMALLETFLFSLVKYCLFRG